MKQPYYITSERLEDILEQQYGLHHRANRSRAWTLTDLLKQCVDTSILYRIYEAGPISDISLYPTPYIPIAGATVGMPTTGSPLIQIPEKNFDGCISWYIADTAQWILWIQSAQDPTKVWAWLIDLTGLGHVLALNDDIRGGGWRIRPTETLRRHIKEWEEINEQAHEAYDRDWLEQQTETDAVLPANGSFLKVHSARDGWTVIQRTPTFAPTWPMLPAIKDEWL